LTLPEIIAKKEKVTEKFQIKNQPMNFEVSDFWSWNQSDLIENRTRGIFISGLEVAINYIRCCVQYFFFKIPLISSNSKSSFKNFFNVIFLSSNKYSVIILYLKYLKDGISELSLLLHIS
jgi:hypothetical protein